MTVYATKYHSYRCWQTLVGGLFVTAASIPFLAIAINSFTSDLRMADLALVVVFGLAIPAVMISVGLWLIHGWLFRRTVKLEISDRGVTYGNKMFAWQDLDRIAVTSLKTSTMLFLKKKGSSREHHLPVTDPWPQEELATLFDRIKSHVVSVHRELRIG